MTYSHNSVRNNIRMTTASATKSIRLKKGASSSASSASNSSTPSPTSAPVSPTSASAPATPLVTAHSNSIASSTNNTHFLSSSPTNLGLGLSSLATPPNQRLRQLQSQSQSTGSKSKQQRQSPPQQQGSTGGGGAFFFANNNRRNGGGRSPPGAMQVRQSPATILGGGFSPGIGGVGGSARKQRKSPPLGGKISPQQQMQQQQHPLIPTALTHFAGSKCFDAPAPTALPKPPQHWTLSRSEGKLPMMMPSMPKFQVPMQTGRSKRNLLDDFDTHNLKLLLNVQS
ncbi:mucin-13 [Drosophila suzukii]|uniref:Mucin-13 n=1 Tax=Drosophila suzukii TaxID=28584 RepID=A0AB40A7N4_DROSZ